MFNLINVNIPINIQIAPSVQTGINLAVLSPGAVQQIAQANEAAAGFLNLNIQ